MVDELRNPSPKAYHKQVELKRDNKIKGTKIADNYLNSDSRDFWKEAEKLRGRKNCQLLM